MIDEQCYQDDPYTVLEINRFASTEEIKKSYRRLCLKYHPDKCGGNSDHFIKVQNAYDKLMKEKDSNINFFIVFLYFLYSSSFSNPQDITLSVSVTIEDIYNNRIKKLTYTRFNNTCKKVVETMYLELQGWKEEYVLENFGDYHPLSGKHGNLIIKVNVVTDSKYKHIELNLILNRYDLYSTISVDLYEYMFGANRTLLYFNDEELNVHHTPRTDGDVLVFANKGLWKEDDIDIVDGQGSRGDLYVFFNLDIKRSCDNDNWKEIEQNRDLIENLFHK